MVRVHFGPPLLKKRRWRSGGLAQLGERLPCKQEVSGSIPLISTKKEIDWSTLETRDFIESLRDKKLKDVPWKLNIVIIDAIYEKATVKENFLG